MVKLYYTPTSCGAASFIIANLSGLKIDCAQVDLKSKKLNDGSSFTAVNPKGNVPCLVLDDGIVLNENISVLCALGEMAPEAGFFPTSGNERLLEMQALSFVGTELHASFRPLFYAPDKPDIKNYLVESLHKCLQKFNNVVLGAKPFLVMDLFTAADAYAYICLSWAPMMGIDLSKYSNIQSYCNRVKSLKHVTDACARMNTNPATVC